MSKTRKYLFLIAPSISMDQLLETGSRAERIEFVPPYGPLSIIAYVRNKCGVSCDFIILDLKLICYEILNERGSEEELIDFLSGSITGHNPDYIGISALFSICCGHLSWIEEAIIKSKTGAITIIGGALATGSYEEILDIFPRIQIVSYAEGEIPSLAIIEAEDALGCFKTNPSVVTRESLKCGMRPAPQYLENLDEIPAYDLSIIDLNQYQGIQYIDNKGEGKCRQIDLITSRGCPFNCVFCSCHLMYGKRIRFFSVDRICREIQRYYSMGMRTFRFYDENFFFERDRAIKILEKIVSFQDKTIGIEFPNGMMTARIDDDLARLLGCAGLKKANLAVESGSDHVLKYIIDKPVNKDAIIRAVQALKKNSIEVVIYIVTGFPGETDAHREETVLFVKSLAPDWVQVTIATPFKGSRLYELCEKSGYLHEYDIANISMKRCLIKTPDYSPEHIEHAAYFMNLDFNFISNNNLLNGRFERALSYFGDVLKKFPRHAFAHYCAYECYRNLGQENEALEHLAEFRAIIRDDVFWRNYAIEFKLPGMEQESVDYENKIFG